MKFFFCHEFSKGRLESAVFLHCQIGKSFGPEILGKIHQGINLFPWHSPLAFGVDSSDAAALGQSILKYGEFALFYHMGYICKLHPEAQIRLVGAKPVHGLLPGHSWEGEGKFYIQQFLEQLMHKPLIDVNHIIHIHKGKLHVDLGKLRLPVGPQVLIPITSGQLEIPVVAGTHEKLFKQLGRLGKGIEGAWMNTAGNQIIPCSLRRTLNKRGGLDLKESFLCQKLPGENRNSASEHHVSLNVRPSQIQEAVF